MFREALAYPTRSPEGGRSVIAGGIALVAVAVFVGVAGIGTPYAYFAVFGLLPWLLVRGYYIRVVRTTIGRDRPTPPRFGDVRRLLRDGATAVGISVGYLLPGALVLGPLVAVRWAGIDLSSALVERAVPEVAATAAVSVTGVLAVVSLMYVFGALYVLPVAVARFAHSGAYREAFEIRTVVAGGVTEDYAIAWGISFVLQAFLLPVAYLFQFLLVGFFLQFIVAVGVRYCYGQGVGTALGLTPVPAPHERSDPDEWGLDRAVRRVESGADTGTAATERTVRPKPSKGQGSIPAVRRIEDDEWEPAATDDDGETDDSDTGKEIINDNGPDDSDGEIINDNGSDDSDGEETFGGGFRPAVNPDDRE